MEEALGICTCMPSTQGQRGTHEEGLLVHTGVATYSRSCMVTQMVVEVGTCVFCLLENNLTVLVFGL